jgi:hypothetical protein
MGKDASDDEKRLEVEGQSTLLAIFLTTTAVVAAMGLLTRNLFHLNNLIRFSGLRRRLNFLHLRPQRN